MPTTSSTSSLDVVVGLHCVTDYPIYWPASATSTSGRPVDGPRFSII